MQREIEPTRQVNLSEIEAKLDARANVTGDRSAMLAQPLERLKIDGQGRSPLVVLPGESVTFGRAEDCVITITDDGRVSRVHCAVDCLPMEAWLRDLHSTNGTYLNGQRIKLIRLMDNDRILIGTTVFIVRVIAKEKS